MKKLLIAAAITAASLTAPAFAAVSVSVGEPGFYGRIDIGGYSQPRVIYGQPVVVERYARHREPVYLHVPVYQTRNWNRYCGQYDACGVPVYFVQDDWYRTQYVPVYRERHYGHRNDRGYYNNRYERHDGDRRDGDRYDSDRHDGDRGDHHGDHH